MLNEQKCINRLFIKVRLTQSRVKYRLRVREREEHEICKDRRDQRLWLYWPDMTETEAEIIINHLWIIKTVQTGKQLL